MMIAVVVGAVIWLATGDDGGATRTDAATEGQGGAVAATGSSAPPRAASAPVGTEAAGLAAAPAASRDETIDAAVASSEAEADAGVAAAARVQAWLDENARTADALVDTFCDEATRLRSSAFPQAGDRRDRDAWAFMSVRIDWEEQARPPGLLHLSSPLRQRLREYGSDWPARIRDYDLDGLDFTWMSELHAFDHWDVMRDMRSVDPRRANFFTAAIPNFIDLTHWVKLRFARALVAGDFAAASAETRQLATLLRSTGLLVADMQAYRMLQLEAEAHAYAVASGRKVGPWQPVPAEELARYRRVVRSSPQFFAPGVSQATMKRALECNTAARCSAIFEGVGLHASAAHLARTDTTAQVDALADRSGCDPRTLEWLRQTPRLPAEEVAGSLEVQPNPLEMLRADGGT